MAVVNSTRSAWFRIVDISMQHLDDILVVENILFPRGHVEQRSVSHSVLLALFARRLFCGSSEAFSLYPPPPLYRLRGNAEMNGWGRLNQRLSVLMSRPVSARCWFWQTIQPSRNTLKLSSPPTMCS